MAIAGVNRHSDTPPSLMYILVSLTDGALTREEIEKRVAEYSHGLCRLLQPTTHRWLKFMLRRGWIEIASGMRSRSEPRRTIYYRLLPPGQRAMDKEINRLQKVIALGKKQLGSFDSRQRERQKLRIVRSDPDHYGPQITKQQKNQGKSRGRRPTTEETMSTEAAAALLHVPRTVIHRMIAAGILKATPSVTRTRQNRWNIAAHSVTRILWRKSWTGEVSTDNSKKRHYSRGQAALSIKEAARYASVTRDTIKRWLRTAKLEVANPELRGQRGMKLTLNSLRRVLGASKRKKRESLSQGELNVARTIKGAAIVQEDRPESNSNLPISVFYILISLASRSLNRKEITRMMEQYSRGVVRLSPWMVQERLSSMLAEKWIEPDPNRRGHPFGPDYFRLSPRGRDVIAAQIESMEEMVTLVKTHLGRSSKKLPTAESRP